MIRSRVTAKASIAFEPVLDLFRGGFLLERTDYGRELHVLLRHDFVDHVAYEAGDRLVEMGRNPHQKLGSIKPIEAALDLGRAGVI